jgi:hypothetical protein
MTLGSKRRKFSTMLAQLILYANDEGYGVAVDFVKRCEDCPVGHPRSAHKSGLAADINLYDKEGTYLTDPIHHEFLHDYWDSMEGAERIDNDMNHYSLEHQGVR